MKLTMEPQFAQRKDLVRIVEAAVPFVEEMLDSASARVTADFALLTPQMRLTSDKGIPLTADVNPLVRITVSDDLIEDLTSSTQVAANELRNVETAEKLIFRTWRDLARRAFARSMDYLNANLPSE
jgi:hypothetical protein